MLHEFITTHHDEIVARCRAMLASRPAPRATDAELEHGVPLFLEQLAESLRLALTHDPAIGDTATAHGEELLARGFTIAQVVHDYGGVCQAVTEMAVEQAVPITTHEFRALNLCLDNAIAAAVSEYSRLREHEGTERLGRLAHELRNLLYRALLSFEMLQTGRVGVGGSTSAVLGRSLNALRDLVDRELAEVRLGAGIFHRETIPARQLLEDAELAGAAEANARGLQLTVESVEPEVTVSADRQLVASVLANLLQNAFKFSRPGGHVQLRARTTDDRVLFEVQDQCGGLPPGKAEAMFAPFAQGGADRTGLGLGLGICARGARANDGEVRVVDLPGQGCVFTLDLPRSKPATS